MTKISWKITDNLFEIFQGPMSYAVLSALL